MREAFRKSFSHPGDARHFEIGSKTTDIQIPYWTCEDFEHEGLRKVDTHNIFSAGMAKHV
jgi:hypothetical protein